MLPELPCASVVGLVLANPNDSLSPNPKQTPASLPAAPSEAVGVEPVGVEPVGVEPVGVEPVGVEPVGGLGSCSGPEGTDIDDQVPRQSSSPRGNLVTSSDRDEPVFAADSWLLTPYDQTTLAGLLLTACLLLIGWSGWQAAGLRTRMIEIDRARRTELRFEVDLNTASPAELANLPGVGPKLAAAIVAYRREQGGIASAEQLLNVTGIGEAKLRAILPFLRPPESTAGQSIPQ